MNLTSTELNGSPRPVHVGMDVHKETIALALAWQDPQRHTLQELNLGVITNDAKSIRRRVQALRSKYHGTLHFVYEAGACGYTIFRQLNELDVDCSIIAPSLIPRRSGDRVKTDRRDAQQLARLHMAGLLTPIWIPDATEEAVRDLSRCRFNLKARTTQQKVRIQHFLLRHDRRYDGKKRNWTAAHRAWMKDLKLTPNASYITLHTELEMLEALEQQLTACERDIQQEIAQYRLRPVVDDFRSVRRIDYISALALLTEIGDMRRFPSAAAFMSFLGLTPSEHSSGERRQTGGITRTGTPLLRRLLIEAAWTYRYPPRETYHLQRKAADASPYARERAWAAQKTLTAKYRKLGERGKHHNVVVPAVAHGLAGYFWDIACHAVHIIDADPMAKAPSRHP